MITRLSALALVLVSGAALADGPSVKLDVARAGLKWTGPCRAAFYALGDDADPDAVAAELDDVNEPIGLAAGRYHAVVSCPSTEGELRTTVPLTVGKKSIVEKVKLEPAFVVVNVKRNGEQVPADVVITDRFGRKVSEGRDHVALPIPAGKLMVRARVDKKAAKRRKPVVGEVAITARVGKKETPVIDTSDGKVLVTLLRNGKPAEGIAAFRIPGEADRLVEVPAGEEAEIPPGAFDMITQLSASHDYQEVITRNVQVRPGKLTKVTANHAVGELKTRILLDGKPLDPDVPVELDLYLGAAPEPFNTLDRDDTANLRPGTFRVRARYADKTFADGTPWSSESTVKITAKKTTQLTLDVAAAGLDVEATVGTQPHRVLVEVFVPKAKASAARKRTGKDGRAHFDLANGRYRVRATLITPQGDFTTESEVTLIQGKQKTVKLDLDLGTATVQVFEKGVAKPARVLFYEEGAAAPILNVPAGQKAYLPPGQYTLAVRHKGKRYTFSTIRIAPGRDAERQLELLEAANTHVDATVDDESGKAPGVMPEGDD